MDIPQLGRYFIATNYNVNLYVDKILSTYGITHGQIEYLLVIADNDGINQNDIAKRKNVGKASVTKAVKILEQKNFIRRIVDESDKRNYLLYTTEASHAIVRDVNEHFQVLEKSLYEGLDKAQVTELNNYLDVVYENSKKLLESK